MWHEIADDVADDPPEDLKTSAEDRYYRRIRIFEVDGDPYPRLRHRFLWFLHNCVSHPLLALSRSVPAIDFHEATSKWLNHENYRALQPMYPRVRHPVFWFLHNAVSHPLIGIAPCKKTFDLHDWTAKLMDVPGWI